MRVELALHDGTTEIRDLAGVMYLPICKNPDCVKKEFRTNDPRKEYCSYECQERAKYRRWQQR